MVKAKQVSAEIRTKTMASPVRGIQGKSLFGGPVITDLASQGSDPEESLGPRPRACEARRGRRCKGKEW